MKKIIILFLIFTLAVCALCACEKKIENPWEDPALSEEDARIREIADPILMDKYGFSAKDLFHYEVSINTNNEGGIIVFYKLCFYGYDTYEHYWVNLSSDYEFEAVKASELGVFSCFLPNITEKAVKDAEKELDEKLKSYESVSDRFLSVDDDGNLCLTVEVIEDIDPPIADENGNTEGCGLDHRHILVTAVICGKYRNT